MSPTVETCERARRRAFALKARRGLPLIDQMRQTLAPYASLQAFAAMPLSEVLP